MFGIATWVKLYRVWRRRMLPRRNQKVYFRIPWRLVPSGSLLWVYTVAVLSFDDFGTPEYREVSPMPTLKIVSVYNARKRMYVEQLARARAELEEFRASLIARFGQEKADAVRQ